MNTKRRQFTKKGSKMPKSQTWRECIDKYFKEAGANRSRCLLCTHKASFLSQSGGQANFIRHLSSRHTQIFQQEVQSFGRRHFKSVEDMNDHFTVESNEDDGDHPYEQSRVMVVEAGELSELKDRGEEHTVDGSTIEGTVFFNDPDEEDGVEEVGEAPTVDAQMSQLRLEKMRLIVYKLKLEALKMEQELKLPRSTYTSDV